MNDFGKFYAACHVRQRRSANFFEPEVLTLDHPFLFFIKENETDYLFFGRFGKPADVVDDDAVVVGEKSEKMETVEKRSKSNSKSWRTFFKEDTCSGF